MRYTEIQLYYRNVTADVVGKEHGITKEQFKALAEKTSLSILRINEERKNGKTPYRELPFNTKISQNVKELVKQFQTGCENLVVLGIGGSALGNIALQTALNPYMYNMDRKQRIGPRLFVFDNVDPHQLASFLDWLGEGLEQTVFNVISKSGRTSETAAQFMIIRQMLLDKLGPESLHEHIVATTDAKQGTLRKIADESHLQCLEVPDGVGGRFSVLSAVGLFSAAMCGIDVDSLLAGARDMDKRVSSEDFYKNPAAINAAVHYHFFNNGKRISVMMPYSHALKDFADWYRQLWAESLGKKEDVEGKSVIAGATPVKALGTTDQHSQVQLYREGPNDKLFTFLQVRNFDKDLRMGPAPDCAPELDFLAGKNLSMLLNSEKTATEYALIESKRPCLTVLFEKIDAYSVGQFIYLYEVTTSITGTLFNINPYNQPAVELGKEATFALMGKSGTDSTGQSYSDFAQKIQSLGEVDESFLV